jgi:hypothetical protein
MNASKSREKRFWKKWYQSGAVKQLQLSSDDLKITGVGTCHGGPHAGHSILSIGDRVLNSNPDWSFSKPVCVVVVPTKNYEPGMKLNRLPGNAVPVDVFF